MTYVPTSVFNTLLSVIRSYGPKGRGKGDSSEDGPKTPSSEVMVTIYRHRSRNDLSESEAEEETLSVKSRTSF